MAGSDLRYSIDTSSIVAAWGERYPLSNFPTFWVQLDALITSRELVASREVLRELERRDPDLHAWFKPKDDMFIEIDDPVQEKVAEIMGTYPKLVDERTGKSAGDPFVIALASVHNPPLTVITEEQGGSLTRPKIPVVCDDLDIPCINLLGLIQEQGWKF